MKTLNILSRHTSLSAAVLAAGIDLSYNEPLARRDLASMDRTCTEAFVVRDGESVDVYYTFKCDLKLLNKYSPFDACLHNGPFSLAAEVDGEIRITGGITGNRKVIASMLAVMPPAWAVKL